MSIYKIKLNDTEYLFEEQKSISDVCKLASINLPSIYLNDDIDVVEIDGSIFNSSTLIEDNMEISTNSKNVYNYIENKIREIHAKLSTSCQTCSVVDCPLKQQFNLFNLSDNGTTYKDCAYYQNGIRSNVLYEVENHIGLEQLLTNKNIHKVAIIDYNMKAKTGEILNKGFNEVITSDFVKKFKIIEESALILEEIAKSLDKRPNLLPVYVLEDNSLKHLLNKEQQKHLINVGSLIDITRKVFKVSLDYQKVEFIYITNNSFNNETNQEVTFDYLMTLPNIESSKINNITKMLRLNDVQINYNSFVNYLIDIFKSKQKFTSDIYQLDDYEIKLKGKTIKLSNIRYSECKDSDIILVLNEKSEANTPSILYDEDVNYVYKNFLKKPGDL